jgi:hypothetical protein
MPAILRRFWQKINAVCHICHSWQHFNCGSITAMSIPVAVILLAFAIGWSVLLVAMIRNDGHGRLAGYHHPPRSHVPDSFDPALHL